MVETHIGFVGARAPTVTDVSDVQVLAEHELSEKLERDNFYGKFVGKGDLHNLVNSLCKLQSHYVFKFLLYYHLFYAYEKATDWSRVEDSPNPVFI